MKSIIRTSIAWSRNLAALGAALAAPLLAHQPVTARYGFEEDVRPIFERRCGSCHRPDGPAPMSLLDYDSARPWAQGIKEEVLDERMPPRGAVEGAAAFIGGHALGAREIDRIADWASGGAPRRRSGAPAPAAPAPAPAAPAPAPAAPAPTPAAPAPTPAAPEATAAAPEATAAAPEATAAAEPPRIDGERLSHAIEHALAGGVREETIERELPIGSGGERWIRAIAFTPGSAAIVRAARLDLVLPGADPAGELLLSWIPGDPAAIYPAGAARRLPRDARARIRIRYRRPWHAGEGVIRDRSAIEIILAAAPPAEEVIARELPAAPATPAAGPPAFTVEGEGARLLAITPLAAAPGAGVEVRSAAGEASTLLLRARRLDPAWPIAYRLERPLPLAAGAAITAAAEPPPRSGDAPIAVWIEVAVPFASGPR